MKGFLQTLTLNSKRLQALNSIDILNMIPKNVLSDIREKDPNPYFQAYSICHEGVSSPKILGDTAKPIKWTRRAIQSIKNIITKGVKFFKGHNDDSSTDGRREIGEVVASLEKEIGGKLHHVVVSYHKPEVKEEVKNYDICSQEATWNIIEDAGQLIADTIEGLTGIALSSSKEDSPAFAGAKRLGMVQALDEEPEKKGENKRMLTFIQIKEAVKDMNILPRQLYTADDIKDDRELGKIFDEMETLKKSIEEKDAKIKDLEGKKEAFERQAQLSTVKSRLEELMTKAELTPRQKTWINQEFKPDTQDDLSDESLTKLIEEKTEAYKRNASYFSSQGDTTPNEFTQTENNNNNPDDLTRAENNPLLVEDFETEDI